MRSFILVILALFTIAQARRRPHRPHDPCLVAFKQCDWEFRGLEGKIPTFRLNPPDQAITPQVVSKNRHVTIGVLNTNGIIPEFISRSHTAPITKFGLTPTHFKPFSIPKIMGSGVGHEVFQKGQLAIASGRCVRVFFSTFQLLVGGHPPDVKNINVNRHDFKCVVFRTKKH